MKEKKNPDFNKPTLEEITEEVEANDLKKWDIIAIPDWSLSMSIMDKYVYEIEEIDRAKAHIVLIIKNIWGIRTITIREKTRAYLLGLFKEEDGDEKEIVIYKKYKEEDDGELIRLAFKNNYKIKKVTKIGELEKCIDDNNIY